MPSKHMLHLPHRHKHDVDMTQGNIFRHLLSFALPLLIGNLFQQLYNTVDTWVIGNYVSTETNTDAYSAVGAVAPIINMLIGFFNGLSSGAGVVISQYYGAKQEDNVRKAVHTAISMTLVLGIILTAVGLGIVPLMLNIINMPDSATDEATVYLTVYFSGLLGLMLYNIGAGILRAVGDSKRPFYYLATCAVSNIILDLVFVLVFKMNVEGVALATVISQALSAVLVILTLLKTNSCVKLRLRALRFHWEFLKKIFSVGLPAAIQLAITSFSNIFVQSYINDLGTDIMSGWTSYTKVDQFLFLPMQSIALASTTFVGQNLGCGQSKRAKKGVNTALIMALCATTLFIIPIVAFAPQIAGFFNKKPEVVSSASLLLRWLTPFYILCCFNQVYAASLRGAGNAKAPMVIMLCSFVLFRQIFLFVMSRICNELIPMAMSYPAGWLLCSTINTIYFHSAKLENTKLVDTQAK